MPCIMLELPMMSAIAASVSSTRLLTGKLRKQKPLKSAMIVGLILGACMRFIIGHPAGAVHSNGLMNCVSCGNIIPNCGNICGRWITGHWNNLAPAR